MNIYIFICTIYIYIAPCIRLCIYIMYINICPFSTTLLLPQAPRTVPPSPSAGGPALTAQAAPPQAFLLTAQPFRPGLPSPTER